MPDDLVSLCDLVEVRAMEYRIPLVRLWERVFAAIRDGKLDFGFPDEFESEYGGRNPPPHRVKHIRENQCVSALSAIENCDAVPPWSQLWVRRMLVSEAAFDKALFPADHPDEPTNTDPASGTKRGRRQYDFWPEIENHIFDLLVEHGPPSPDDPELPNQKVLATLDIE